VVVGYNSNDLFQTEDDENFHRLFLYVCLKTVSNPLQLPILTPVKIATDQESRFNS